MASGQVAWRLRPAVVWSDYGGRGRHVALRWRGGGEALVLELCSGVAGTMAGAVGAALLRTLLQRDGREPAALLAVPAVLMLTGAVGVATLAWLVLDFASRRTIEGAVVFLERTPVPDDAGHVVRYHHGIAVDDGRSDTATVYRFGSRSRHLARRYREIADGDVVRLTVLPRHGRVLGVEVLRRSR